MASENSKRYTGTIKKKPIFHTVRNGRVIKLYDVELHDVKYTHIPSEHVIDINQKQEEKPKERCNVLSIILIALITVYLIFASGLFVDNIYYSDKSVDVHYDKVCGYGTYKEDTCICIDHYVKFDSHMCNYHQLSHDTAVRLNLFCGMIGGSYYYIELYQPAIAQLSLVLGGYLLLILINIKSIHRIKTCIWFIVGFDFTFLFFWWIVNIHLYQTNYYTDANGIALY